MARDFKNSFRSFNMPLIFWVFARMYFGIRKPRKRILGTEFAGDIEAVGNDATRFQAGDQVFGYRGQNFGANAEYLCMPEDGLVALKPANMTHEEAATIPGGTLTALSLLRKANIQRGQKVLINGASGGIGSAAVQLAKHYGAEVTGVCGAPRIEFVKVLGADRVIDYTKEDFTESGETYDLVVDVLGKSSFSRCRRVLNPGGRCLLASFKMKNVFQMLWTSVIGNKKVTCALAGYKLADLDLVRELVEAGKIRTVIGRCFPLEQAAEAHRYAGSGQKRGPVVIVA